MLTIKNLHASVDDKAILKGIDLNIQPGEVHAIMGPNGSGKSTLSHILAGRDGYTVTQGQVDYQGHNLLELPADERACQGIFLGFQYPVEIPGVTNIYFLKAALNAKRRYHAQPEIDAFDFLELVKDKMRELNMDESLLYRDINGGFSGGEKKRNEILQMSLLDPTLAILDETDSGLDIDALRIVADGINHHRSPKRAFILITHYQRLLHYIKPDYVHVLAHGKILTSGGADLAQQLEERGYQELIEG